MFYLDGAVFFVNEDDYVSLLFFFVAEDGTASYHNLDAFGFLFKSDFFRHF